MVWGRTTGVRARAGSRYPIRDKSGGRRDAIVSGAIEDIARRPRGSRREITSARTRGAPRRRAPPSHRRSHHRCTGEKKRRVGGGGTAGRAPTTRRTGIREGRTVRVLVGAPEAFNVVPIPPCASAPRGAPLISPATHAPVTPRRGRKKNTRWTLRIQLRALRRAGAMRRRSTHLDEPEQRVNIIIGRGGGGLLPLPTAARGTDFSAVLLRFGIGIAGGSPSSPNLRASHRRTRARVPEIRAFADFRRDHDLRQDLLIVRTPSRFLRSCAARVTVPMQRGREKRTALAAHGGTNARLRRAFRGVVWSVHGSRRRVEGSALTKCSYDPE